MKEVSPKMYTKMQVSGNFKSWAKDMKDYLFWYDRSIKELIEYFYSNWTMGQRLSYESRNASPTGSWALTLTLHCAW